MKFVFAPIWSWPVVISTAVVLVVLVLWTYPRRVRHLPPWRRRILVALRLLALALLIAAMIRPAVEFTHKNDKPGVLHVLVDSSRSMSTQDGPGGMTRRQAVLNSLRDLEKRITAADDSIKIAYYDFADSLTPVEKLEDNTSGGQSAIGLALETLTKDIRDERAVGVFVFSDGAQRAVPPFDVDPREQARRMGQQRLPISTFPIGGSGLTGASADLAIDDFLVDPVHFEKKAVPVLGKVRVQGAAGREIAIRLLVEDPTVKKTGADNGMRVPPATRNANPAVRVTPKSNDEVVSVELSFIPEVAGELKLGIEAVPLEDELKTANNRRESIITVLKGGLSVAYFDKVRPETKSLRTLDADEKIQFDEVTIYDGQFQRTTEISPEMFMPGKYDVYVIGDVPAQAFEAKVLRALADRVSEGAGLMMIGGYRSFGAGGWADTPLAEMLPVRMNPGEAQSGDQIASDLHYFQPMAMLPTRRGEQQYIMRLAGPSENRERWQKLPPLEGANKLTPANDAVEVLAASPDGIPLLFAHEYGKARVLAFAGDTTYLWFLQGFNAENERFWRQAVMWLARKELEGEQPVWVRIAPRNFSPGQRVSMTFGARTEDGRVIPDADFKVKVTNPAGEAVELAPRRFGEEGGADFESTSLPGDYWVEVAAERGGNAVGFPARTRFIVDARDLELDNPSADYALMEQIAALSGGISQPPDELDSYVSRQLKSGMFRPADLSQVVRVTLWDNWPFLLAFVGVLSTEWFLRKRRGLV